MGDRIPAFRLVEFHVHHDDGDDAETESTNDEGSRTDGSERSTLRRLGAFAVLGGVALALERVLGKRTRSSLSRGGRGAADRLQDSDAIDRLRESDYSSRVPGSERIARAHESDRASRIADRDPADRLREETDEPARDTGVGTDRDVGDEIDPGTTDVETAEDAGIGDDGVDADPEVGLDEGSDGNGPDVVTDTEAGTPAEADVAGSDDPGTDTSEDDADETDDVDEDDTETAGD